jgi:hypothetical protein
MKELGDIEEIINLKGEKTPRTKFCPFKDPTHSPPKCDEGMCGVWSGKRDACGLSLIGEVYKEENK